MAHTASMNPAARADFSALLADHRRLVFKVAHTYGRSRADVEDLAQEIAVQSWRSFRSYDPARSFSTWLYRIALNVAISWLRSEGPRRRLSVPFDAQLHDAPVSDVSDEDDGSRILRGFIASLGPFDRALLLLYLEDRPGSEIAEIIGLSTTHLTTKVSRLKERLRAYAEKPRGTR